MKNIYVSLFSSYKNSTPLETISLYDFFTDDTLKKNVEYIRTLTDKEDIKHNKSKLPAITPSGIFQTRKISGLIEHSGYICIDIDAGDNPHIHDFNVIRDELRKSINISYASLSVSGKGVFCIIPIKEKDKHVEHFEALRLVFAAYGITIDKGCKDISRLRGYSYDPNAYFNEDAVVFTQQVDFRKNNSTTKTAKKETYVRNLSSNHIEGQSRTREKVIKLITQINSKNIDITETYHQWFQIGCALANEFGEDGREMFHLVSQNNPGYHHSASDNLFSNCLEGNYSISIGTFFYYVEQYGFA